MIRASAYLVANGQCVATVAAETNDFAGAMASVTKQLEQAIEKNVDGDRWHKIEITLKRGI